MESARNMLEHILHLISDEENHDLEKRIEEYEILNAIWSLFLDKYLIPYGQPIHFYREY